MASIETRMTALGVEREVCWGCGKQFERGGRMNGVKQSDGEGTGWFCDPCIDEWLKTKQMPQPNQGDE